MKILKAEHNFQINIHVEIDKINKLQPVIIARLRLVERPFARVVGTGVGADDDGVERGVLIDAALPTAVARTPSTSGRTRGPWGPGTKL